MVVQDLEHPVQDTVVVEEQELDYLLLADLLELTEQVPQYAVTHQDQLDLVVEGVELVEQEHSSLQ
jgi:hypothetical protein